MKCRWLEQTGCQEGDQPWKKVRGRTHPMEKKQRYKGQASFVPPHCRISATESDEEAQGRKQSLQDQKMGLEVLTVA